MVGFLFLLVLTASIGFVSSDLAGDRAALLTLRAAVAGRTMLWDAAQKTPCQWTGVHCDQNRVTALRLPGVSISGEIPAGIFGNLTELRTLSLRFNALAGELPSDLGKCVGLRNLYLQGNRFSGELPEFLFGLENLVRLNLAENNFSGRIPNGFNKMTRLRTLYLEKNRFVGSVPDLNLIGPNLGQFNISFNSLNGSIPKSLDAMPVSAFIGNKLCGSPLKDSCVDAKNISVNGGGDVGNKGDDNGGLSGGAIAGIVIGSVVGVLVLLGLIYVCCRKKRSKKTSSVDVANVANVKSRETEDEKMAEIGGGGGGNGFSVAAAAAAAMMGTGKVDTVNSGANKKLVFFGNVVGRDKMFDLEDLLRASAEVLGKGTFGTAYKAVLEAGIVVAVKRLKDVTISEKEFREKIEAVGAMDHENLVPLKAYYYSREEKLLVYDYMPMGSLSALLHGETCSYIVICLYASFWTC